jgi:nitrate/TMAO reductase-like tetraheme cytochrome c subunit
MLTAAAQADPPTGQTFTGSKKCASCHFDQYMTWKKTKHAEALTVLPAKYKADPKCLKCHVTGFGVPTGFTTAAASAALAGVSCEVCHGPGSEHEKIALKYAKVKLTEAQEKEVRGSIWLLQPGNICITCHLPIAHKAHEKFDK